MLEILSLKFPLFVGIIAAGVHVLTGPDHLAAVTPLVFETKKGHWKIGLLWGIGHIAGMLLIGLLFFLFKDYIPVEAISKHSEQLVGFILIGLGLWAFYRIKTQKYKHAHPHSHSSEGSGTYMHVHEHNHNQQADNHTHSHKKTVRQNSFTASFVGIIHGFAGISHFVLMLPVLGYSSKAESFEYMVGFALGTIFTMLIFAFLLGKLSKIQTDGHNKHLLANFRFWAGLLAVSIGVFWLFSN